MNNILFYTFRSCIRFCRLIQFQLSIRRELFEKVSTMGNVLFYLSLQTTSELIEQENVVSCTCEVNTADIQGCFSPCILHAGVPLQRDEWLDGEGNGKK